MGLVSIRATRIIQPQRCLDRKGPLVSMGLTEVEDESLW
jgi:hypothetical protein